MTNFHLISPLENLLSSVEPSSEGVFSLSTLLANVSLKECVNVRSNEVSELSTFQKLQHLDDMLDYLADDALVSEQAAPEVSWSSRFAYRPGGLSMNIDNKNNDVGSLHANYIPSWGCSFSPTGVSFDSIVASGCLNCGNPFNLADLVEKAEESAEEVSLILPYSKDGLRAMPSMCLKCKVCDHVASPLHFGCESDSVTDAIHLREVVERSLCKHLGKHFSSRSHGSHFQKFGDFSNILDYGLVPDGIYLYGNRNGIIMDGSSKKWWKSRFLGKGFIEQKLQKRMRLLESVSGKTKRGVICKELCDKCGNDTCFFSTFQARSADEGMTIMYECTKCLHRKVLNA